MAFFRSLDICSIDSPAEMCRALQCLLLATLNPADAGLFGEPSPGEDRRDLAIELRDESFIVVDEARLLEYRISVTDGQSPRPVELDEPGRQLLRIARRLGVAEAIAVLEGEAIAIQKGADLVRTPAEAPGDDRGDDEPGPVRAVAADD